MTRTALLLSSLWVAACTVGELPEASNNQGTDAGGEMGNGCQNRNAAPDPPHDHGGVAGATNAGMSCVASGCHLEGATGTDAPAFEFAGTVYKTGAVAPNAGVIITITKVADGTTASAITDTAGNFHVPAGMLAGAFPATVNVSACPTISKMVGQLAADTGPSCNGGGTCHGATAGKIVLADQ
jgi:hypothetical protein